MRTAVITGSSNGLGLEMAKCFRRSGLNVVVNGTDSERIAQAAKLISELPGDGRVLACRADISNSLDVQNLIDLAVREFGQIDYWINNAGVNQPNRAIWELSEEEVHALMAIDLHGTITASRLVMLQMISQHFGAIYNVEGYGSNDAYMLGLGIYGTAKRAITYFTQALAKESEARNTGILVGRLSPGILITNFTTNALGSREVIQLSEKTIRFYNIMADRPQDVAPYLVNAMLKNRQNNVHLEWLTTRKVLWRFLTAASRKNRFF